MTSQLCLRKAVRLWAWLGRDICKWRLPRPDTASSHTRCSESSAVFPISGVPPEAFRHMPGPKKFSFHNSECSLQPSHTSWEVTWIPRLGGDPMCTYPSRDCLPPPPPPTWLKEDLQQAGSTAEAQPMVPLCLLVTYGLWCFEETFSFSKRSCPSCLLTEPPLWGGLLTQRVLPHLPLYGPYFLGGHSKHHTHSPYSHRQEQATSQVSWTSRFLLPLPPLIIIK